MEKYKEKLECYRLAVEEYLGACFADDSLAQKINSMCGENTAEIIKLKKQLQINKKGCIISSLSMKGQFIMWTSIYMAQSFDKAKDLRSAIEKNGIIVMLKQIKLEDRSGEDCYEILVPGAEIEKALEVIIAE